MEEEEEGEQQQQQKQQQNNHVNATREKCDQIKKGNSTFWPMTQYYNLELTW